VAALEDTLFPTLNGEPDDDSINLRVWFGLGGDRLACFG
jgi:hypothetical protein